MKNRKKRERLHVPNLWLSKWLPALLLFVAGLQGIKKVWIFKIKQLNLLVGGSSGQANSGCDKEYDIKWKCTISEEEIWTKLFLFLFFSPSLQTMNLPILTCSYCMRKVGLWNFYQMDGTGDGDESAPASGPVSSATPEVQDDEAASTSSAPATTPLRMKLRSQDTTHPNQAGINHKKLYCMCAFNNFIMKQVILVSQWFVLQGDGTPSLVALRARTGDTPIPCEELSSPLTRGKRITRNRGQGADSSGTLPPLPKRLCLSSVGGPVRTSFTHKYIILVHPWCETRCANIFWIKSYSYIHPEGIALEPVITLWYFSFFGMFSF